MPDSLPSIQASSRIALSAKFYQPLWHEWAFFFFFLQCDLFDWLLKKITNQFKKSISHAVCPAVIVPILQSVTAMQSHNQSHSQSVNRSYSQSPSASSWSTRSTRRVQTFPKAIGSLTSCRILFLSVGEFKYKKCSTCPYPTVAYGRVVTSRSLMV